MEETVADEDIYNWTYLLNGAFLCLHVDTASKSILLQTLKNLRDAALSARHRDGSPDSAASPEDASTANSG